LVRELLPAAERFLVAARVALRAAARRDEALGGALRRVRALAVLRPARAPAAVRLAAAAVPAVLSMPRS